MENNRDTRGADGKSHQKETDIEREINKLIKSKATDHQAYQTLKAKYGSDTDIINKIMRAYKDKLQMIFKKAKKFKDLIMTRYAHMGLTYPQIIMKAKKYQDKYNFTNDEFDMFIILATTDKAGKYAQSIPHSELSRTLGFDATISSNSKINVKTEELVVVEEIVRKWGETKPLHAQVLLQSMTYTDCAFEALKGDYDHRKNNPYNYVHPVIAALFIPRVQYLEERMLLANIGYIVKCKSTGEPIMTLPDFKLYWDMVIDPNEAVCASGSAIVDLRNRFFLQTQLWDAVLNLRQGKYYYGDSMCMVRFMQAIEQCKNIIHDAPDLTYVKDEGTILRRLLSAFSLYPTYVSVNKLIGLNVLGGQYGLPTTPYDPTGFGNVHGFNNVTKMPMITLRLPLTTMGVSAAPISLETSLSQPQWFVEHKTIVPRTLQIIHSNDVLFFYVGRRYQNYNIANFAVPCNFSNLPMTVNGFETLNSYPIEAPATIPIINDTYVLRSVVLVEKTAIGAGKELIVGSSTLIVIPRDVPAGNFEDFVVQYNPQSAANMTYGNSGQLEHIKPVSYVQVTPQFNNTMQLETFSEMCRTRGTIFMYVKIQNLDCLPSVF